MSLDIEQSMLEEASRILHREIDRDENLHEHLNINKLLAFIQGVHGRLGIELNVNSVYLYKSVGELAEAVCRGVHNDVPKLLKLSDGGTQPPMIIFAGGVSCFLEIKSLLQGITHEGAIYGMNLTDFDFPNVRPATVSDEIDACLAELERQGIDGPVCVLGYSLGGIFALELARKLRASGREIRLLGLIDTPQSEHVWPLPVWIGYVLHRLRRRLRKVKAGLRASRTSPVSVSQKTEIQPRRMLLHRLRPLIFRFCSPKSDIYPELAPEWVGGYTPDYQRVGTQLLRMKGLYRPTVYDGRLVYYRAKGGDPTECDQRLIWQPFLPNAEWVDVRGNHLSVIVGKNGVALGQDISRRLERANRTALTAPAAASAPFAAGVAHFGKRVARR
ncbi:thioesterase domain-containing protein [Roseibium marinum]|uniref:Thioesterase domain-containing protein n=1 Tax=Roseibium marinum TaxID=281252 RepID=A0A2S3UMH3_9HYPH|nr:thioesterase domain-containing protein [Roseibium marinum]POF28895.1 thioesterase domain-containing protein [Roseibium marinum]